MSHRRPGRHLAIAAIGLGVLAGCASGSTTFTTKTAITTTTAAGGEPAPGATTSTPPASKAAALTCPTTDAIGSILGGPTESVPSQDQPGACGYSLVDARSLGILFVASPSPVDGADAWRSRGYVVTAEPRLGPGGYAAAAPDGGAGCVVGAPALQVLASDVGGRTSRCEQSVQIAVAVAAASHLTL